MCGLRFFDESEQMVSLAEEQWAQLVGEQSHMSVQALCSWVGDLVKECVSVCHVTGSKEFSMADCLHVLDKGDMVLCLSREEEVSNGSTRRLVRVLKEPVVTGWATILPVGASASLFKEPLSLLEMGVFETFSAFISKNVLWHVASHFDLRMFRALSLNLHKLPRPSCLQ